MAKKELLKKVGDTVQANYDAIDKVSMYAKGMFAQM